MAQAGPLQPIALVVEDDYFQREFAAVLLDEWGMNVIQCDSAEDAIRVLQDVGQRVSMTFTDVQLAGSIDGVELAHFAARNYPHIHVIVTSGRAMPRDLPEGVTFFPKPWLPLDMLREAERAMH